MGSNFHMSSNVTIFGALPSCTMGGCNFIWRFDDEEVTHAKGDKEINQYGIFTLVSTSYQRTGFQPPHEVQKEVGLAATHELHDQIVGVWEKSVMTFLFISLSVGGLKL